MITIVDGYNLLFAQSDGRIDAGDAEKARTNLVRELNRFAGASKAGIIVVFDSSGAPTGATQRERVGLVTVVYARQEGKADAEILRIVRAYKNPAELRVVTSDNSLSRFCKQARAAVIDCQNFMKLLGPNLNLPAARRQQLDEPSEKFRPPGPHEVEFWLKEFEKAPPSPKRRRR